MILDPDPTPTASLDTLTHKVIGQAMYVHRTLGSGFLESVYQNALVIRLQKSGFETKVQHPLLVYFEDEIVGQFFADLLIDGRLIVELKAVSALSNAHEVQVVNYLTATRIDVGLLLNFGTKSLEVKRKYRTLNQQKLTAPNPVNPVNPV